MREILFRGKRKDDGKWIDGDLIQSQDKDIAFIHPKANAFTTKESIFVYGLFVKVLPDCIGQFTGLSDKNSNKIFDGDIVKVWYDNKSVNGIIEYHEENACCLIYVKQYNRRLHPFSHPEMEVVGNMYDNPELLEVED